jgi:hypothetical protein
MGSDKGAAIFCGWKRREVVTGGALLWRSICKAVVYSEEKQRHKDSEWK